MAKNQALDQLLGYGLAAGGVFLVYNLAKQGSFGEGLQDSAFDLCKALFGEARCRVDFPRTAVARAASRGRSAPPPAATPQIPVVGSNSSGGSSGTTVRDMWRTWQAERRRKGENPCDYDAFFYHHFALAGYALGDENMGPFYADGGCA